MERQPKKWYATWKFALAVFLLGLLLGSLIPDSWLNSPSGLIFRS